MKDYDYKMSAAGRINIIGEHIDYCGGKVMPAAISLKNTVYVRPNGTDKINLSWTTLPDKVSLDINKLDSYKDLKYGNYQAGAALMWQRAGHKIIGVDMLYDCTVPFGSGLSSSAAIEVSTIAALATVAGEPLDKVEIALKAQQAEREYAGVNCGIMDQYASACGKKNSVMLLDCNSLNCEYIPLELGDCSLVITNCNKPHNLVESKYNERREQTEEALKILQKHIRINCLAELSLLKLNAYKAELPPVIFKRARHVVTECGRVYEAAAALKNGDMKKLGKLLNASHTSLRDDYETTGIEPDALVEVAQRQDGCLGSRLMGGGFGGCTISLVKKNRVEEFKQNVQAEYEKATGYAPTFYDVAITDGITVEKL
ncbi:MAG: galactokinase [Clostridiales bacterium]|nr:galactokinase [Clostridiales bacterium]